MAPSEKSKSWTLWELNPRPHALPNAKHARYQLCQKPCPPLTRSAIWNDTMVPGQPGPMIQMWFVIVLPNMPSPIPAFFQSSGQLWEALGLCV
jgi:hypothetical protein